MRNWIFLFAIAFCLGGCCEKKVELSVNKSPARLAQFSTINALLTGDYDGRVSCGELLSRGNFGLGTFDALDGEMLVLDGKVYQVKSDGKVYHPALSVKTPFASLVSFKAEKKISIEQPMSFENFTAEMNQAMPNLNVPCAFKAKGIFSKMKTRSVPAQSKPYPPLSEVTKTQPVFERENVSGTIVGFRSPDYMKTLTVPGYHLHFLADDESFGGHILDFVMEKGTVELQPIYECLLILPRENEKFGQMNLSTDRSEELKQVEGNH